MLHGRERFNFCPVFQDRLLKILSMAEPAEVEFDRNPRLRL